MNVQYKQSLTWTQTIEMLDLITINHVLDRAKKNVIDARKNKKWANYLSKKTKKNSQFNDVKCFFENKWNIKCSYVNENSFVRLRSTKNCNLIFVSTAIVINWMQKIEKHLCDDSVMKSWCIKQNYSTKKLNHMSQFL